MQACFPQPPFSPHSCQGHPSSHILDTGASCSQHLMRLFITARMEPWLCSRHSGPGRVHPSLSVLNSNWGQPSPSCWSCSTPDPTPNTHQWCHKRPDPCLPGWWTPFTFWCKCVMSPGQPLSTQQKDSSCSVPQWLYADQPTSQGISWPRLL